MPSNKGVGQGHDDWMKQNTAGAKPTKTKATKKTKRKSNGRKKGGLAAAIAARKNRMETQAGGSLRIKK